MIIFDLDQTLIDSYSIKKLRDDRQWQSVYNKIPTILPFEGINDLINILKGKIPLGIVTSSPRPYCQKIIKYNKWAIDTIVCYHDTTNHKPHPEPILKAIEKIGSKNNKILSVGDEVKDVIASKKAGTISIAALWGTKDRESLLQAEPDHVFETVDELKEYVVNLYGIE